MRSVLLILPFAAFTLGCAGHAGNRAVSPIGGSPLTGNSVPTAPALGDLDSLLTFASGPDSQLVAADVAAGLCLLLALGAALLLGIRFAAARES